MFGGTKNFYRKEAIYLIGNNRSILKLELRLKEVY